MRFIKPILVLILTFPLTFGVLEAKEKKYKNGDFYSGEWKKGKPNGQGKMTFSDGNYYDGLWIDGKIGGEGVIKDESGTFEGTFTPIYQNDVLVSIKPIKGISITKNGSLNGEWDENNVFTGEYSFNGMKYTGTVEGSDLKQGRLEKGSDYIEGTMLLTPQFEGNLDFFLNSTSFIDKPARYKGKFSKGKFIGNVSGTNLTPKITTYNIDVDASGNQSGILYYGSSGKYDGEINDKKREGTGKLINGLLTIEGVWMNDQIVSGTATETVKNSENGKSQIYNYEISNGKASYTFPDGEILAITNPLDGSSLYPPVEKRQKEKDELARQEFERKKEEERKLARAKDAKAIDQKYAGMVFEGEGSLLMLSGNGEAALIGFLIGANADQILSVSFLPGGKVNVRERDVNVRKPDPSRVTTTQLLAMAVNSGGGTTFEATLDGNKIRLDEELYIVVSPDKKTLSIYGPDGGYKLKRK